jgi:hypothetical protein
VTRNEHTVTCNRSRQIEIKSEATSAGCMALGGLALRRHQKHTCSCKIVLYGFDPIRSVEAEKRPGKR